MSTYRKKLIEVALPLDAINKESAREKSNPFLKGHPRSVFQWWARRPLAACRAVLFGQMVDDPSSLPDEFPTEEAQEAERERLFRIIEELVKWENSTNEAVLHAARVEIARSAARNHGVSLPHSMTPAEVADALKRYAPPVLDPFAGGGSIPLEAQRLGLEAHASDLNPVAVLINKALIEIPPKFAGRPPVNPESREKYLHKEWKGAQGLAEDVRYYGKWMRDEAFRRIGHLYPKVRLPKEQGGGEAAVIAWLWARTVTCPNPACGAQMPLVRSFALSTKKGKEAWVEPVVDRTSAPPAITFAVRQGKGAPEPPKVGRGAQFRCLACGTIAPEQHIKDEALAGRMGAQMLAIVAEGKGGRVYLPPSEDQLLAAASAQRPENVPNQALANDPRALWCVGYGLDTFDKLFTPRQLVALTTFSDLVGEARERVLADVGLTPGLAATPSPSPMERGMGGEATPPAMERGLRGEARRTLCRELRQRQTPAEDMFWELVRDRRFHGYKFRRQHPLGTFVADFYCPELRLVVELDGGVHTIQQERDRARDAILAEHSLRTIRIRNEDLLADPEAVLARLDELISPSISPTPLPSAPTPLSISDGEGAGGEAPAYADAVVTYLALAVSRWADFSSSISTWNASNQNIRNTFARQAIEMAWDYAEVNPFGPIANVESVADSIATSLERVPAHPAAFVSIADATAISDGQSAYLVSTDPPYYDNIGYADLSDFFYVWLRRSLGAIYPELFSTLLVPKAAELVATPYRFGGNTEKARHFFEHGLGQAFDRMREAATPDYPLTVYYAFKQAESEAGEDGTGSAVAASTGWETMLEGLLRASFSVHGTWPMRSERGARMNSLESNALASSIVLVCRPRPADAPVTTRRDFLAALKRELPTALRDLQRGNIAPVDLAQAAIGPGMAVFSRYSRVLESDGSPMRVRTALQLINQTLDEVLAEQEGEYDADTRFAVAWFEQYGMGQGKFGEADVLARAKNTSVGGLDEAGILDARGGNVRLLRRDELPEKWNPQQDHRLSVWKVTQHLIHALMEGGGTQAAAALLDAAGSDYGEKARDLAYRLYTTSERRKWTQEAFAYNTLVTEWHDIAGSAEGARVGRTRATAAITQGTLLGE